MALLSLGGTSSLQTKDVLKDHLAYLRPDVLHISDTSGSPNQITIQFYNQFAGEKKIDVTTYQITIPASTFVIIPLLNVGKYLKFDYKGDSTFDLVVDGMLIQLTDEDLETIGLLTMAENINQLKGEKLQEW